MSICWRSEAFDKVQLSVQAKRMAIHNVQWIAQALRRSQAVTDFGRRTLLKFLRPLGADAMFGAEGAAEFFR